MDIKASKSDPMCVSFASQANIEKSVSTAASPALFPVVPPQKWLFIDGAMAFGGHEVMLLRWMDELTKTGAVIPRLVARDLSRLSQLVPPTVLAGRLPTIAAGGKLRSFISRWQELRTLLKNAKREQADVCIFASGSLGDQVLLTMGMCLLGQRVVVYVPMLGTFAEMGYRSADWKDRFVRYVYARFPAAWIAISENQAVQFRAWARPRGPVHVLPNTVGMQFETGPRLTPRPIAADGRIRVLVLGRMDAAQKGLDMLVQQLLREPEHRLSRFQIGIVGEGPYRETLIAELQQNPSLAACVSLDAWRPTPEVMSEYDFLLLPSRFEGVPLVMLEALALGLPVVASDLPGTRDYLPPQCLFPVGEIGTALRIVEQLADLDERRRLVVQGRTVYEEQASSAAFARNVATLANVVAASHRDAAL